MSGIKCNQCQHRGGRHSADCVLVTGKEGVDFVTCNLCGISMISLVSHLKKNHPGLVYDGQVTASASFNKRSNAHKGRECWITKLRRTNSEECSQKIAVMAERVRKTVMENSDERQRRSKLLAKLWIENRTIFVSTASETAKKTSSRPEILQARSERLANWRRDHPEEFFDKCTSQLCGYRTSVPEKALFALLVEKFPTFGFKGNQTIYRQDFSTPSHRRQIDVISKPMRVIVEFDGILHFENIPQWNQLDKVRAKDFEFNSVLGKEFTVVRIAYDQFSYKTGFSGPCLKQLQAVIHDHNRQPGVVFIGESYSKETK